MSTASSPAITPNPFTFPECESGPLQAGSYRREVPPRSSPKSVGGTGLQGQRCGAVTCQFHLPLFILSLCSIQVCFMPSCSWTTSRQLCSRHSTKRSPNNSPMETRVLGKYPIESNLFLSSVLTHAVFLLGAYIHLRALDQGVGCSTNRSSRWLGSVM